MNEKKKAAVSSFSGHNLSAEEMQAQILRNHLGSRNAAGREEKG